MSGRRPADLTCSLCGNTIFSNAGMTGHGRNKFLTPVTENKGQCWKSSESVENPNPVLWRRTSRAGVGSSAKIATPHWENALPFEPDALPVLRLDYQPRHPANPGSACSLPASRERPPADPWHRQHTVRHARAKHGTNREKSINKIILPYN